MTSFRRTRRFVLVAAVGVLGACTSATAPGETDLALARQRWALSNVRSYDYTIQRECFCAPAWTLPVTVTVTNGLVTGQVYADTGLPVPEFIPDFTTVDALFGVVERAYTDHADGVTASYDPTTGVPLSIAIDPSFHTADEEVSYSVSMFHAR